MIQDEIVTPILIFYKIQNYSRWIITAIQSRVLQVTCNNENGRYKIHVYGGYQTSVVHY